ncbi:hypothetical protein FRC03_003386 [Tulasnella sp. 419]|nr:hypothetical protein FRC03_003386 [Tulasnella sp. 419]
MTAPKYDRSILILHLESILHTHNPWHYGSAIAEASSRTNKQLRILILSELFDNELKAKPAKYWSSIHNLLSYVYAQATLPAHEEGRLLMNVEVIFRGLSDETSFKDVIEASWDHVFATSSNHIPQQLRQLATTILPLSGDDSALIEEVSVLKNVADSYPVVALGGTFDHLHAGHKILLTMSAWIATEKVIVGVTDDVLLVNKSNKHIMEPLAERIENVRRFLNLIKPGLTYDVVAIQDVYGPTAWDPNVQALVVSKETLSGAEAVRKKREEESFPALQNFVIDVISPSAAKIVSDDANHLKTAKMSSTFIRQWIVDKQNSGSFDTEDKPRSTSPDVEMPGAFPSDSRDSGVGDTQK